LVVINSSATKSVTAGTAAVEPVMPAIPANSVVLATVFVPASDTTIENNQITDRRVIVNNIITPALANANSWTADQTFSRIVLTGDITDPTFIAMDISAGAPSYAEGNMYWDTVDKTLAIQQGLDDVTLQVGQEMYIRARNSTGSTITNGSVVFVSGVTGNRPNIVLAKADSTTTAEAVGIVTHDIENNTDGIVTTTGLVRDVDTSGTTAGDTLYLSAATAGEFVNTAPSAPNVAVVLGTVTVVNASVGILLVNLAPFVSGARSIGGARHHSTAVFVDDVAVALGTGSDIVVLNRSTILAADAELTDVVEGTSDHQGVAANSLIISNITNDGDMLFLVSDAGNSKEFIKADGANAVLHLGHGMVSTNIGNAILVAPALGTPASGVMTNVTGLPISSGVSGLGTNIATFLATPSSANLAAAVTNETGSGLLVFGTSPTFITPALGTPASGVLTNATGYPGDSSLVVSGALNSGSITSGFGTINTGSSTISTTGTVTTGAISAGGGLTFTGANPSIIGGDDNGVLSITADTAINQGGNIKLYGNNHSTLAQDIEFYADATLVLSWDESEGNWDFASQNIKSAVFVAPALGTPASGVMTNVTGLPAAAILQGTLASGMVLVAPVLGTPASGVMTNMTGLPVTGLANGTDGELITWSAIGVAETVAVGTATHVLTSNGVGVAPTFQAAAGGQTNAFAFFIS